MLDTEIIKAKINIVNEYLKMYSQEVNDILKKFPEEKSLRELSILLQQYWKRIHLGNTHFAQWYIKGFDLLLRDIKPCRDLQRRFLISGEICKWDTADILCMLEDWTAAARKAGKRPYIIMAGEVRRITESKGYLWTPCILDPRCIDDARERFIKQYKDISNFVSRTRNEDLIV